MQAGRQAKAGKGRQRQRQGEAGREAESGIDRQRQAERQRWARAGRHAGADTLGQRVAYIPCGLSLTPPKDIEFPSHHMQLMYCYDHTNLVYSMVIYVNVIYPNLVS
jgi:hypothetical protein